MPIGTSQYIKHIMLLVILALHSAYLNTAVSPVSITQSVHSEKCFCIIYSSNFITINITKCNHLQVIHHHLTNKKLSYHRGTTMRAYNRILRLLVVLINGVQCHWVSLILNSSARTMYLSDCAYIRHAYKWSALYALCNELKMNGICCP